ncbi:hypothetical protein ACWFRB_09110 [Rhodococcus sp. NPDC055112]
MYQPNQMRPSFAARHPIWTTFGGLAAIGLVAKIWPLLVLAGVAWVGWKLWKRHLGAVERQRAVDVLVAARADYEHQEYLAGNRVGIYGQYPPAA